MTKVITGGGIYNDTEVIQPEKEHYKVVGNMVMDDPAGGGDIVIEFCSYGEVVKGVYVNGLYKTR